MPLLPSPLLPLLPAARVVPLPRLLPPPHLPLPPSPPPTLSQLLSPHPPTPQPLCQVVLWGSAALRRAAPRDAVAAPAGNPVVAVAAAADSAWALFQNGTLAGWGLPRVGGTAAAGPSSSLQYRIGSTISVAASAQHSHVLLARRDGSVWFLASLAARRRQLAPAGTMA